MFLRARQWWANRRFSSKRYWEERYAQGGNSGSGSSGRLSEYKAEFLNALFQSNGVDAVIEWGCGDGKQLALLEVAHYTGVDVSHTALELCRKHHGQPGRTFLHTDEADQLTADTSLSLDVLYHLVEDPIYWRYLHQLFASAERFVVIYSCDREGGTYGAHVKPRVFTADVARHFPDWKLVQHAPNPYPLETHGPEAGSWSDFYVYAHEKTAQGG